MLRSYRPDFAGLFTQECAGAPTIWRVDHRGSPGGPRGRSSGCRSICRCVDDICHTISDTSPSRVDAGGKCANFPLRSLSPTGIMLEVRKPSCRGPMTRPAPKADAPPAAPTRGAWTEAEIRLLIDLWSTGDIKSIASRLGRPANAVAIKASRLSLPAQIRAARTAAAGRPGSKARTRPCLCCGTPFFSEGPQHRICDQCKGGDSWRFGSAGFRVISGGL